MQCLFSLCARYDFNKDVFLIYKRTKILIKEFIKSVNSI